MGCFGFQILKTYQDELFQSSPFGRGSGDSRSSTTIRSLKSLTTYMVAQQQLHWQIGTPSDFAKLQKSLSLTFERKDSFIFFQSPLAFFVLIFPPSFPLSLHLRFWPLLASFSRASLGFCPSIDVFAFEAREIDSIGRFPASLRTAVCCFCISSPGADP